MPRLRAALSKTKKHMHRPHASGKQALAMIWGCFSRYSGGSATPSHAAVLGVVLLKLAFVNW